jgi:uncharacterized protein YbjT (DUF2867 family)
MTILVTGATGNIGRRVVDHLIRLGANDVRALTVNPDRAALPDGVTALTGYLGRPESLRAALDGVKRVYLAPYPPTGAAVLDLLRSAGVEYVVALTGGAHWQQLADTVTASGVAHTQLGPGEFCDNFTMWAPQIRTGVVADPRPGAVQAPVAMDDIARVAAHLLVDPRREHLGAMYELTGPEAITRAQIAGQIGAGLGLDVRMRGCSRAEAEALLRPVMGDAVAWYLDLLDQDSPPQPANDLVRRLTGAPAMTMAQWAAANAALFA